MSARTALALALVVGLAAAGCRGSGASPTTGAVPTSSPQLTPTLAPPPVSPEPSATSGAPSEPQAMAWSQLSPTGDGPAAREDHTWTVDEAADVAYLFGGRADGTTHGDLWAYDLAADSWQRIEVAGAVPAARFGHEAAWVPGTGLVVFGGQAGSTFFGDLWRFDPAAGRWEELPAAGAAPVARYGSCSAVGSDGRLWISHGFTENGTRFDDTRAYDFAARAWTDETPGGDLPVKRCLHVCWWTADGRLALYGGQTNGTPTLGDLWALPGSGGSSTWTSFGDPLPLTRNLVAAATVREAVFLFGGRGEAGVALDALHRIPADLSTVEAMAVPGAGPSARWAATLVHDAGRGRVLLFGGRDGATANAETWALPAP